MPQKILVVGSKGQLGTALRRRVPDGSDVLGVDCDMLDITDKKAVFDLIHDFAPQQIINTSAYTDVEGAEEEPDEAIAVNSQGVAHLALAAEAVGARVIHVSTDYVFKGDRNRPYRPDDLAEPLNVYGKSKLSGERELAKVLSQNYLVVRSAWLYSPWGENFVVKILRRMRESEKLTVVADQIGTPTSALSLAEVLWRLVDRPELTGTYHWTDGGVASWYDFACLIHRYALQLGLLNRSCRIVPITTDQYPLLATRPVYSVLDTTLLCKTLTIKPIHWSVSLSEVLQDLAEE